MACSYSSPWHRDLSDLLQPQSLSFSLLKSAGRVSSSSTSSHRSTLTYHHCLCAFNIT